MGFLRGMLESSKNFKTSAARVINGEMSDWF